jgi:DNA polymerase III delta subunit
MLYVFFGSDEERVRETARRTGATLFPSSESLRITPDSYEPGILLERSEGASLFGSESYTILDMLSEEPVIFDELKASVPDLAASSHAFFIIERVLTAPDKKLFEKHATKFEEFSAEKKERFNVFGLTDALLARDKKLLWLGLIDARKEGVPIQEIVGAFCWQMKVVRLALRSKSAGEAGLKPFVFGKAQGAQKKYTREELEALARDLVVLYHDGHLGKVDMERGLERLVLSL